MFLISLVMCPDGQVFGVVSVRLPGRTEWFPSCRTTDTTTVLIQPGPVTHGFGKGFFCTFQVALSSLLVLSMNTLAVAS